MLLVILYICKDYYEFNLQDPFTDKQVQRAVRDRLKAENRKVKDVIVLHSSITS